MDKTLKPLISVVMSVFNSELYVKEAIDSILNQTFEDFEFIILDDGSTDKSVDIIQGYTDSRIRFFQNDKNLGLRGSLNRGHCRQSEGFNWQRGNILPEWIRMILPLSEGLRYR